MVFVAFNQPG